MWFVAKEGSGDASECPGLFGGTWTCFIFLTLTIKELSVARVRDPLPPPAEVGGMRHPSYRKNFISSNRSLRRFEKVTTALLESAPWKGGLV